MDKLSYPVSEPDLSDLELRYVEEAVKSTWISSSGKFLDQFEYEFSQKIGVNHTLAVSNGTVALHLILLGLGIGPGDEVIVPSFTYIASVNAVKYVGATPVFIDINPSTWGIDATQVAAAITGKTKAIIGVHLYGQPFEIDAIAKVASDAKLYLVEDAAEAPFSTYKGKPVGSFGIAASFSFYGNKVISSGEGGAVTTDDHALAERMRLIRSQGMDPQRRYFFPVVGHNFRLTNVAAAILCAQLERLEEILDRRMSVCEAYDKQISRIEELNVQAKPTWSTWTPWFASATLNVDLADKRDELLATLGRNGVDTRPFFFPVHQMPPYIEQHGSLMLPETDLVSKIGFNLPTSSKMTKFDVLQIMRRVESIFRGMSLG